MPDFGAALRVAVPKYEADVSSSDTSESEDVLGSSSTEEQAADKKLADERKAVERKAAEQIRQTSLSEFPRVSLSSSARSTNSQNCVSR